MSPFGPLADVKNDLIGAALCTMVPLMVLCDFRDATWSSLEAEARELGQYIAEHGDNILYRSAGQKAGKGKTGKPGTGEAMGKLARAVAILSFAPGGVKIFGLRFQSRFDADGGNHSVVKGGVPEA